MQKKRIIFRKEVIIILLITCLLFLFTSPINSEKVIGTGSTTITGESITGEATDATLAVSISVITELPTVTIIRPKNHTYITKENLPLEYSANYEDYIWYNLDLTGSNTTIYGNTTFNVSSEGSHTLYLYANNTDGNETSDNVTFTVNLSLFTVLYNEYAGTNKGSSTDFNKSSYEDLQNLSDIVLENTDYGKILFNEIINVTDDANVSDNEVDLDTYTNISLKHIELNPTALPNFNKSATLYLYNLNFTNPRILRDGSICPSTICTEINYSEGGTLVFNVTQFTVYSAEESPEEPPEEEPTPPSGRRARGIKSFSVNVDEILVKLKQGEIETRDIIIKNNLNRQLNITISSQRIENFILIKDSMITLAPRESKSISIDFIARIDDIPELYLGTIMVKADRTEEEILVILEVESKDILLDVYAEIPLTSKRVLPGEDLLAEIMIFNLGEFRGAREIRIEYKIRDLDGNDIFEEHEIITIETRAGFIKKIYIPENIEYGDYILYIRAIYDGEVASASARFEVVKSKATLGEKIFIVTIVFLIIIISFLVYYIIRHPKGIIKYFEKRRFKLKK